MRRPGHLGTDCGWGCMTCPLRHPRGGPFVHATPHHRRWGERWAPPGTKADDRSEPVKTNRRRIGAHILTVTLRFSPSFGSSPVSLALANSKAVTRELAGPSHNSAVTGSIRNKHTRGLSGLGHHTSSVFRQYFFVFPASCRTLARPDIDK